MNSADTSNHFYNASFKYFKYGVYLLLTINVFLFLQEDLAASAHVFAQGMSWGDVISGFAATIDTAAWVILLLLFELETYVIEDKNIQGPLKLSLHGVRILCYLIITYAFYGYVSKMYMLLGFEPITDLSLCTEQLGWSIMTDLDEFEILSADNCQALAANQYFTLPGTKIISGAESYQSSILLGWTDVINAATWLLICVALEIDVRAQLSKHSSTLWASFHLPIKVILYSTLFLAAAYWGVKGDFLDFWDAFLWLLAFVFIEMNIFEWQAETTLENKAATI
jgi:hypothetical protein